LLLTAFSHSLLTFITLYKNYNLKKVYNVYASAQMN
jgi:hypothetical protein